MTKFHDLVHFEVFPLWTQGKKNDASKTFEQWKTYNKNVIAK